MRRALVIAAATLVACGSSGATTLNTVSADGADSTAPTLSVETTTSVVETANDVQPCADVIDATARQSADGTWTISATVRSGDTGWEKYADAWEVRVEGATVAERVLTHPHDTEQPFTRNLSGVDLPLGAREIEVAAHDSVNGFCGETFVLPLAP